jgi:cell wall assembly regulator SMI1
MADIIKECDFVINELSQFSSGIISLGSIITDNRIDVFENQIKYELPLDFKYILKQYNGISLSGVEVYGLDLALRGSSLDEIYQFEHFKAAHKMPLFFLPFSPDGRGNHYCLNLDKKQDGQCPVVFWQWDFEYKSDDEVEECYNSFLDWIKEEMIDWTLGDYNYDGTER